MSQPTSFLCKTCSTNHAIPDSYQEQDFPQTIVFYALLVYPSAYTSTSATLDATNSFSYLSGPTDSIAHLLTSLSSKSCLLTQLPATLLNSEWISFPSAPDHHTAPDQFRIIRHRANPAVPAALSRSVETFTLYSTFFTGRSHSQFSNNVRITLNKEPEALIAPLPIQRNTTVRGTYLSAEEAMTAMVEESVPDVSVLTEPMGMLVKKPDGQKTTVLTSAWKMDVRDKDGETCGVLWLGKNVGWCFCVRRNGKGGRFPLEGLC